MWPWRKAPAVAPPQRDPAEFVERMISIARENGLATLRFCDPDLGEVRAAFYDRPAFQAQWPGAPQRPAVADPDAEREAKAARLRSEAAATLGVPAEAVRLPKTLGGSA